MANNTQNTTNAKNAGPIENQNLVNNNPPQPNVPPTPEKKTIEVDAQVLENLLAEVRDLKEVTKQIEQTAPQDQIRKIEALRASGKLVKAVKVRRFEGKLVIGWKMIKDNVWMEGGKLHEEQILRVFFEDGAIQEVTLIQFTRGTSYEQYEVIKEAKNADGNIELTVQLPNGKELVIDSRYIN